MFRSIKVQLKPNNRQRSLLFQCAGTARFAFNWALAQQEDNYKNGGKFISDNDLRKRLTELKRSKFTWLYNYSNNITKQAVKDACGAYRSFFKKLTSRPKFKSRRRSRPAFHHDSLKLKVTEKYVQLEKFGMVKLAEFGRIPTDATYVNPRVTFDGLHWWISVGVEVQTITLDKPTSEPIGVDLGVKDLAVVSSGRVFENINRGKTIKKTSKKLRRVQRRASRLYAKLKIEKINEKGKNLLKVEKLINKTYQRLTNIRDNHVHQATTELVKTKPEYVVFEDLNVRGMMKNKHLSRAIAQQKLSEFRRQVEYKCQRYGVTLIVANRFYPSSKLCSCCGRVKRDLKLSDRVYRCPCGNVVDRDLQAAINLREYPRLTKTV